MSPLEVTKCDLLIVGNRGGSNIGGSFARSAAELEIPAMLMESREAMEAPRWLNRFNWYARGRRPTRLAAFADRVVAQCQRLAPRVLLATGLAPLTAEALRKIRRFGTYCVNYLTDDPWNPAHRGNWFFRGLPEYDCVFTPRRANIYDLSQICRRVEFLRFGYDPLLFHPPDLDQNEACDLASDVLLAGGADRDRASLIGALAESGIQVRLYGSYWDRYPQTRGMSLGQAEIPVLRNAIAACKVALCLIRRANRDGHCMRTFEVPAVGACMLVEFTSDHVELFGPSGHAVRYFRSNTEMLFEARQLLADEAERRRLSVTAHRLIVNGRHTYRDRLEQILAMISDESHRGTRD